MTGCVLPTMIILSSQKYVSHRTLRSSGEGAPQNFSDGGGRDGISGLTGEVGSHGHNGPEITWKFLENSCSQSLPLNLYLLPLLPKNK